MSPAPHEHSEHDDLHELKDLKREEVRYLQAILQTLRSYKRATVFLVVIITLYLTLRVAGVE
jgi:hypothetical protein